MPIPLPNMRSASGVLESVSHGALFLAFASGMRERDFTFFDFGVFIFFSFFSFFAFLGFFGSARTRIVKSE